MKPLCTNYGPIQANGAQGNPAKATGIENLSPKMTLKVIYIYYFECYQDQYQIKAQLEHCKNDLKLTFDLR